MAKKALEIAGAVIPAQIFTWARRPDHAFIEKTSGGILMLLAVLITMAANLNGACRY